MNSPRNPLREINLGALTCVLLCLLCGQARADESEPVKSLLELRQRDVTVQKWDLSCGAAALATILNYQYGDRITEREVALGLMKREEYLDNPKLVQLREGFSLLDLKRFVDGRGYLGIGLGKLDFMDLIDRAPIMVPIRTNGYNHFVVFRGIARNRVLLADPAWGNRTLLKGDFLKMWIDYPVIGHVGFVVAKADGELSDPKALAPTGNDFVFLR
jgi:hypothetical protein